MAAKRIDWKAAMRKKVKQHKNLLNELEKALDRADACEARKSTATKKKRSR